jgi:calcineurin-like phosphoesterase family protein
MREKKRNCCNKKRECTALCATECKYGRKHLLMGNHWTCKTEGCGDCFNMKAFREANKDGQ